MNEQELRTVLASVRGTPQEAEAVALVQTMRDTRADITEVVALCLVAGAPEAAESFIRDAVPIRMVRENLQRRRAMAGAATHIQSIDTSRQTRDASNPGPAGETLVGQPWPCRH